MKTFRLSCDIFLRNFKTQGVKIKKGGGLGKNENESPGGFYSRISKIHFKVEGEQFLPVGLSVKN